MISRNVWSFITVGLTLPIINEVRKMMHRVYEENEAKKRLIRWSDTGRDFLGPISIDDENIEDYKSLIGSSFRSPAGNMTVHIKSEKQVNQWISNTKANKAISCPFVPAFPATGGYYALALNQQFSTRSTSGTTSISFPIVTAAMGSTDSSGYDPCIILCSGQEEKLLFPDGNTRLCASKKDGVIQDVQTFIVNR